MTKYETRTAGQGYEWEDPWSAQITRTRTHLTLEIKEDERGPTFTGLVDAQGVGIYRVPEVHPIGFRVGKK